MPLTTAVSLATSNASGHRIVCVSANASGAISVITTRWPCWARSVAVAAPMPRLAPVTRIIPPAAMVVALAARGEQSAVDQSLIVRGDEIGRGEDVVGREGLSADAGAHS